MTETHRADVLVAEDVTEAAPLEFKSFLVTCAIGSLVGLTVLAVLAQALIAFLAPTA
jgi:hypothetical protein